MKDADGQETTQQDGTQGGTTDKPAKKKQMSNLEMNEIVKRFETRMSSADKEAGEHAKAINQLGEQNVDMGEKLDKVLMSLNQITSFNKDRIEPMDDLENETLPSRKFDTDTGDGTEDAVIEPTNFTSVEDRLFKEKAANLDFMEEMVEVEIHTTAEQFADNIFPIAVNGTSLWFVRGKKYEIPRKYVYGLLRARPIHYENQEYKDHKGDTVVRYNPHRGLRYGFSIENDTPKGREWYNRIKASEAA